MACAQGVGDIPADPHEHNVLGAMGPFEADRHRRSPPVRHGLGGETIPQIATNENLRQNHDECSWNPGASLTRIGGPSMKERLEITITATTPCVDEGAVWRADSLRGYWVSQSI